MLVTVQFLPPRCPQCRAPMRLVHVLANAHVYPPVRTFECTACEKDTILQARLLPAERLRAGELRN
jgi:hypothetical protein